MKYHAINRDHIVEASAMPPDSIALPYKIDKNKTWLVRLVLTAGAVFLEMKSEAEASDFIRRLGFVSMPDTVYKY